MCLVQMALIAAQIGNATVIETGSATATETGIEDIMDEDMMTVIVTAIEGDTTPIIETAVDTLVDGGHLMILVDHERLLVEGTLQGKVDTATLVSGATDTTACHVSFFFSIALPFLWLTLRFLLFRRY